MKLDEDEIAVITINHPLGLHMRIGKDVVQLAGRYEATITAQNLTRPSPVVDAGSILQLMQLQARQGHRIQVAAAGPDAHRAVEALRDAAGVRPGCADCPPFTRACIMSNTLKGYAAAPGVGIGLAVLYRTGHFTLDQPAEPGAVNPGLEWERFCAAQRLVDDELARLAEGAPALVAELYAAHRVILQDQTLADSVKSALENGHSAAAATFQVVSELAEAMGALDDAYFASRSSDVLDIGQRLLVHLGATLGRAHLGTLPADTILIADDLSPSDVVQLEPGNVLGIALAGGTPTAHSAILARSLGIPLVCGLGPGVLTVTPQIACILDGDRGTLVLDPDEMTLRRARASQQSLVEERAQAARHAHQPAHTRDGVYVPVLANANSPDDVLAAIEAGAEGVGLLRTEYLFQQRSLPPTLEEQVETYGRFMRQLREQPGQEMQLTVRALDAGGDKPLRFFPHPPEDNPFLGLRGVRLLLDEPEILRTQYRALQMAVRDHGGAQWGAPRA